MRAATPPLALEKAFILIMGAVLQAQRVMGRTPSMVFSDGQGGAGTTPSGARITEDSNARITEDGNARVTQ